ncbi:MAG: hypothetical protein B7Z55_13450 [Planctomycetales bacterium 12-60-4]|nr:MAG: hypothetical protein B7Z55_13450 [Planctomycetales bacterium 12-60-4]
MATEPQSIFRPHPIDIFIANTHRGEAEQPRQIDGGLGTRDDLACNPVRPQTQDIHATGVVAAMPLNVHVPRRIGTLSKRCRIFGAGVGGNLTYGFEQRLRSAILEEDRATTGRHDHRLANETDVP